MAEWSNDQQLFELMKRELYTPVVGDVLDGLNFYHQILPPGIAPIDDGLKVAGRAMPVLMTDVFGPQERPFGKLTEALDQLQPGDVYLAGGGAMRCAYWGELLTATARTRGAVGAVIDGYHRDTPQVLQQSWPVFSRGRYAQDSSVRTQVTQYRCPIEIDGVWIEPGDLVFGDMDGVVIVPRSQERAAIEAALDKVRSEKVVRRAIEEGMSATEAFRKYGVL